MQSPTPNFKKFCPEDLLGIAAQLFNNLINCSFFDCIQERIEVENLSTEEAINHLFRSEMMEVLRRISIRPKLVWRRLFNLHHEVENKELCQLVERIINLADLQCHCLKSKFLRHSDGDKFVENSSLKYYLKQKVLLNKELPNSIVKEDLSCLSRIWVTHLCEQILTGEHRRQLKRIREDVLSNSTPSLQTFQDTYKILDELRFVLNNFNIFRDYQKSD